MVESGVGLGGRTSATDVSPGPVCFVRGTRILTDKGEVPVETLAPGACAVTLGGGLRPIIWVGARTLDISRHARPETATPVRVRRGALGNGVPARDLLLSRDHALYLQHALIPAGLLVNGATVRHDTSWQRVEYFHVALRTHGVLLAEGAPAESLADAGARGGFAGGRVTALHPDFAMPPPSHTDCAQRLQAGPVLQDARRALLARARALGHTITRDPDLHLLVDGVRVNPSVVSRTLYRFVLPQDACDVRIVSRAGVPAETDPMSDDRRRLGVMLSRIMLYTGPRGYEVAATDAALWCGFHAPEQGIGGTWRWTDGHARLPPLAAGVTRIELLVLGAQPAWARAAPPSEPIQRGA